MSHIDENKANGYVKVFRSSMENPMLMKDMEHLGLWVVLLMLATHKGRRVWFAGSLIDLKPGQFITGRDFLASHTRINRNKIERILKLFESEQQIEQHKTNRNRLITILNWEDYQTSEQQNEQPVSNQRATNEQPVSTYKNGKNVKNEKKLLDIPPTQTPFVDKTVDNDADVVDKRSVKVLDLPETVSALKTKFPEKATIIDDEIEKAKDWLKANGKTKKDYIAFARNWIRGAKTPQGLSLPARDPKLPRFEKCPRCKEYHPAGACVQSSVFAGRLFAKQ